MKSVRRIKATKTLRAWINYPRFRRFLPTARSLLLFSLGLYYSHGRLQCKPVITAVVNTLFIAIGLRDIFLPHPLPMPERTFMMIQP